MLCAGLVRGDKNRRETMGARFMATAPESRTPLLHCRKAMTRDMRKW
ncbi:hypothetical protein PCO31111_04477 [Pandoraea communis]|uniref:Uncharacterized protein n=1 Tax=Pandoraea communis TaxID=2508297 RepID=A0A5E4YD35_9BURK|nr:hypothetical protein PCO31111_04477 [Pandoraea communis]